MLIAQGNGKEDPRARSSVALTDGAGTDDLMITNEIKPPMAAGPSTGPDAVGDKGKRPSDTDPDGPRKRWRESLWV